MKKVLIVFLCLFSLPAIAWEKAVPKLADDYYLDYTSFKEIGENNILGKVLHNSLCTYYSNKGVIK